jgi:hypothetical protein
MLRRKEKIYPKFINSLLCDTVCHKGWTVDKRNTKTLALHRGWGRGEEVRLKEVDKKDLKEKGI